MITLKRVKYKNLLASGNYWTELDLNTHKTSLIVGKNGQGKSTALESIVFALYGRPHRKINKPQLVNSINKGNLLVELYFDIGNDKYLIRRGMKPNIFEIFKNDTLINQDASNRDYQRYLEENILKLDYKSFEQIVILGSSTYVPFMELPLASRRQVIEDLLDIQVFSIMNTIMKQEMSDLKSEYQSLKSSIEMDLKVKKLKEEHNDNITKYKESENKKRLLKIENFNKLIQENNDEIIKLSSNINALIDNIVNEEKLKNKIRECNTINIQLEGRISGLGKEISFYHDNDSCPTCNQHIDNEFKTNIIENNTNRVDELKLALEILNEKRNTFETEYNRIATIKKNIDETRSKKNKLEMSNKVYSDSIGALEREINDSNVPSEKVEDISDLENEIRNKSRDLLKFKTRQDVMKVMGIMLKDTGIKSHIVKQYIPVINQLVSKYLQAMDFFVEFQLDETFNEKIISINREDFSYNSFSEGEKLRINISLMFAWRHVAKIRNSTSINLLFMDEIMDSSLDQAGSDEFIKIIKNLTERDNVVIISHKGDNLIDNFDRVIRFEKRKGFSYMEVLEE